MSTQPASENFGLSLSEFVLAEAKEKVFEIEIKGQKIFEKEKNRLVEEGEELIDEEFSKKMRGKDTERRIEHSAQVNKCRVMVMESKNNALRKFFGLLQQRILNKITTDHQFYENYLKMVLIQSFIKLMEHEVVVKCLERDVKHVEAAIPHAKKEYQELIKKELDQNFRLEVRIDKEKFLLERKLQDFNAIETRDYGKCEDEVIAKADEDKKCFGGILVTNSNGLIICKNTLDVRTLIGYQESLPFIRQELFK